jgi:hypothetical protein
MTSHFVTINLFTWEYNVLKHLLDVTPQNCPKGESVRIQFRIIASNGKILKIQFRRIASKEVFENTTP